MRINFTLNSLISIISLVTITSAASIRISAPSSLDNNNPVNFTSTGNIHVDLTGSDAVSPINPEVEDYVTKAMKENKALTNKATKRVVIITLGTRGDIQVNNIRIIQLN